MLQKTKYGTVLCEKIKQEKKLKYAAVPIGGSDGSIDYKKVSLNCSNEDCNTCLTFEKAPIIV
ncbi:MAG: hypothetical protein FWE08_02955 [Oscillospiraceae bacterium]|nr:hypothetical protein [Oscillospiraceae bacterium]